MAEQSHPNYVKVWGMLVALLAVSVVGPMFEIKVLTLVTAALALFGDLGGVSSPR